eukprot:3549627-Amphidinium_carterae.1
MEVQEGMDILKMIRDRKTLPGIFTQLHYIGYDDYTKGFNRDMLSKCSPPSACHNLREIVHDCIFLRVLSEEDAWLTI